MILYFDSFGRPEAPAITVCPPDSVIKKWANGDVSPTRPIGAIPHPENYSGELNFNAYSGISLDVEKSKTDEKVFDVLAPYVSLYLDGIGFFIIQECTETRDNEEHVISKSIQAYSAESELSRCEAPRIEDGVYTFVDIIDKCAKLAPRWSFRLENIQEDIRSIERNFTNVEYDDVYSFLMECLQSKYDCVFEFDIINREVYVVSKTAYVSSHLTDIHLSHNNIINKLEKSVSSSETYTAIRCKGGNDLDIADVNPIGGSILYDFTYRLPLMSQELREAVEKWMNKVNSAKEDIISISYELESAYDESAHYMALAEESKRNVEAARIGLDSTIASNPSSAQLEEAKNWLAECESNFRTIQELYDSCLSSQSDLLDTLHEIQRGCSLSVYATDVDAHPIFTEDMLSELSSYINAAEYTNEDITKTDSMTFRQMIEQEQQLMREGQEQLQKVSTENAKFTVTTNDFVFNEIFSYFTKQLEAGSIVYAESSDGVFEQFHISAIKMNFSEQTLELTFSNKYNKYDINSLFDDVFGKVSKSVANIQRVVGLIEDQQPDVESWMEQVRRLTVGNVISSTNEDVIISESGYWGRRVEGYKEDGTPITDEYGNVKYDPEQIKIIHNGLYITSDNWSSVHTAIGKLQTGQDNNGNPTYSYGIIGDVIIGKLLLGNQLYIQAESNDGDVITTIDGNGITIYNGQFRIFNDKYQEVLYLDNNGEIGFSGYLTQQGTDMKALIGLNSDGYPVVDFYKESDAYTKMLGNGYWPYLSFWPSAQNRSVIDAINGLEVRSYSEVAPNELSYGSWIRLSEDYAGIGVVSGSDVELSSGEVRLNVGTGCCLKATVDGGHLYGTWYYNSSEIVSSDRNAKHDIENLPEQYDTLFDLLNPVRFKYNDGTSDRYHTGFIAQEVEDSIQKSGLSNLDFAGFAKTEDGKYGLRYDEFIAMCVYQIQRLKEEIKQLSNR